MPYVNIRVAGSLTIEQKREIAKDVSDSLNRVAGKPKESCYITFDEVPRTNWAKGYDILDDVDKRQGEKR